MTVQERVQLDLEAAIILRDNPTKDILKVVIGEFNRGEKIVKDEKALHIIKKMYQNAKEFGTAHEMDVLEGYLPKLLSKKDLTTNIEHYIVTNNLLIRNLGKVMSFLKTDFPDRYDGKIAASIAKEILLQQS